MRVLCKYGGMLANFPFCDIIKKNERGEKPMRRTIGRIVSAPNTRSGQRYVRLGGGGRSGGAGGSGSSGG